VLSARILPPYRPVLELRLDASALSDANALKIARDGPSSRRDRTAIWGRAEIAISRRSC